MRITDTITLADGRTATVENYEARECPGKPTGFAGTGYLVRIGENVTHYAWRVMALEHVASLAK